MTNSEEKIIETDEDTAAEDKGDGGTYPYDPVYQSIEVREDPSSIYEYLRRLKQGKIIVQPDFQRNQVWSDTQKSKFIESIILNYPLPPIYLNETIEATYIVIDGLQRTIALRQYYEGEFALQGLEALPKYNDYYFKNLPEAWQARFEDKKLTVFVLKPSTPMEVIYDLFNRINTGGTQLNRQEVRNGIFIGKSTKLLKELSEEKCFKKAIDGGVKETRMKDREVVLRYLAFKWFDYKTEYAGDMSAYVEASMKKINKMSDEEIDLMKSDFKRVMQYSFEIWGDRNFRIPIETRETRKTRGTINIAILETVGNYLSFQKDDFLQRNREIISDNYKNLISNTSYLETVTKSTNTKSKVVDRFRLAYEILNQNTI